MAVDQDQDDAVLQPFHRARATMSHSTTSGNGASVWRIERFELIFYNARHRRWQYFAEDPTFETDSQPSVTSDTNEAHRRQIQRFLSTFRRVVTDAVSLHGGRVGVADLAPQQADTDVADFVRPAFEGWADNWDAYLDCLLDSVDKEGLPTEVVGDLQKLTTALRTTGAGQYAFKRSTALALLSLLPIREEWDTWGRFADARSSRERDGSNGLPPSRPGVHWFQPFYLAEFRYNDKSVTTTSISVLGPDKGVALEAGFMDLAVRGSVMSFVASDDFFVYCRQPKDAAELYLYRCYGHFVDDLIPKLSTSRGLRRHFVIAYPVQVAGRLHFAQVAITAAVDARVNVGVLSGDWANVHDALWIPECISAFESALERISLSAFQAAVDNQIRQRSLEQLNDRDVLRGILAQEIFHVLPVRAITAAGKQWRYNRRSLPGIGTVGREWLQNDTVPDSRPNDVEFTLESGALTGRVSTIGDPRLQESLIRSRTIEVIEQQLDYLYRAVATQKYRNESVIRNQQRAYAIVRRHIENLDYSALRQIATASDETTQAVILSAAVDIESLNVVEPDDCPLEFRRTDSTRRSLRRYLSQAKPGYNEIALFNEYQRMAAPSPIERASALLDSSLIKAATHDFPVSDYFSAGLERAKEEVTSGFLAHTHETLDASLRQLGHTAMADKLQTAWNEFKQDVCAETELTNLRAMSTARKKKAIGCLREEWKGKWVPVNNETVWQEIAPFLSWEWLRTWLDVYCESANGYQRCLSGTPAIFNSVVDVSGARLPPPHDGDYDVNLKDIGMWLPYIVTDRRGFFEKSPAILNHWVQRDFDKWARLYLVLRDTGTGSVDRFEAGVSEATPRWLPVAHSDPLTRLLTPPTECNHRTESLVVVVRTWVATERS